MSTTRVAISCSEYRDYCFGLTFATLFWRDLIGFEPFVLLVEDRGYWQTRNNWAPITLDALDHHKIHYEFIGHVEGYETGRIGQNGRQHAALGEISDDTWLMMSDADLWPLRREWYHQHEKTDKRATCYYSNGDHFQGKEDVIAKADAGCGFQTIPTCHVTMRVWDWKERYGLTDDLSYASAIKRTMDSWMGALSPQCDRNFEIWMMDQRVVTDRLCRAPWFPDDVLMIPRDGHPSADRLCRSIPNLWTQPLTGQYVDAHIWNAPDREDRWKMIRPLIEYYLPQHLGWADDFRNAFRGSYVD